MERGPGSYSSRLHGLFVLTLEASGQADGGLASSLAGWLAGEISKSVWQIGLSSLRWPQELAGAGASLRSCA